MKIIKNTILILSLSIIELNIVKAEGFFSFNKNDKTAEYQKIFERFNVKDPKEVEKYFEAMTLLKYRYKCKKMKEEKMYIKDLVISNMICIPANQDIFEQAMYELHKQWDLELREEENYALDRAKVIYNIKKNELKNK